MLGRLFRKKPKECNLILSAGGIRCLAHIGAIKALELRGWKVRSICGVSGGSIVAAPYAFGVPTSVIEDLAVGQDFNKFKQLNFPSVRRGVFKFKGLGKWIEQVVRDHGSGLQLDLNIPACSLTTANKIVFSWKLSEGVVTQVVTKDTEAAVRTSGMLLAQAIEATCSIPFIFEPKLFEGEYYVDGALWSSVPVHFYEDEDVPTFVIHVQNSHINPFYSVTKPLQVIYRVFEVFQINRLKGLKKRIKGKPIYIIEPTADNVSPLAFSLSPKVKKAIIESATVEVLAFLDDKFPSKVK